MRDHLLTKERKKNLFLEKKLFSTSGSISGRVSGPDSGPVSGPDSGTDSGESKQLFYVLTFVVFSKDTRYIQIISYIYRDISQVSETFQNCQDNENSLL